jgi:Fic family protein
VFASIEITAFGKVHTPMEKEVAKDLILLGSLNVSRTKVQGANLLVTTLKDQQVTDLAERNFSEAIDYILENYQDLPINLNTAQEINKILTSELVPEKDLGNPLFRPSGIQPQEVDFFIGSEPKDFYKWMESEAAQKLMEDNPILLAEIMHNTFAANDAFPDGNGRTSRLMADLVLLKAGYAPAKYTSMDDYFAHGNSRAAVTRFFRKIYFDEIVRDGQEHLRQTLEESL